MKSTIAGCVHKRFNRAPGNGNSDRQTCCSGRKPGPVGGQRQFSFGSGGTPRYRSRDAVRIGVVLLGRREHARQFLDRGVDLVGSDQPVDQHPTVALPRRHFVVACPSATHCHLPVRRLTTGGPGMNDGGSVPGMATTETIPRWDLSPIFAGHRRPLVLAVRSKASTQRSTGWSRSSTSTTSGRSSTRGRSPTRMSTRSRPCSPR